MVGADRRPLPIMWPMARGGRWLARALVLLALVSGLTAYVLHAGAIGREVHRGEAAYATLCQRLAGSAGATGSPGTLAQLVAAMQVELRRLEERYPRWYAQYRQDPRRYSCGPSQPNTQIGSDR